MTDPEHRAIAGAEVTVISDDTGVQTHAQTNGAGLWQVNSLIAGHYHFTVTTTGFANLEHSSIDIQIGDVKSIDVQLKVGSVTNDVVVTTETPLIDTTAAVSGVVLNSTDLEELPTLSNSPTELAVLAPGVFLAPPTGGAVGLWSGSSLSAFTVNGSGSGSNALNYVLDGATDTIVSSGNIAFIPPSDAISQMRVLTSAYDASVDRTAAGTINLSFKSGTEHFHGVLYERNQNNFLNANYVQNRAANIGAPHINFNEYGGTIGGPVWLPKIYDGKKRGTFFFFSYDGIHNVSPNSTNIISIPTLAERNGDFSQSFEVINNTSYKITVYDPATINTAGNRQPFGSIGNSVIPASRISPTAKALLALLPQPNLPHDASGSNSHNYLPNNPKVDDFYSWIVRLDQSWNNNHHSYLNYRRNSLREMTNNVFGLSNLLSGEALNRDNYGLTLNHIWTFSPRLVGTFNVNGTVYRTTDGSPAATTDPTPFGFSQALVGSQPVKGFPQLQNIFGLNNVGDRIGPTRENDYQWEGTAALTQLVGRHSFRYGVQYLLSQEASGNNTGATGIFNFDPNWTSPNPNATAPAGADTLFPSFLLGLPSSGNIVTPASAYWSQPFVGAYFQDDWRTTPRLTLSLGLRWDVQLALTERHDRYFARFDPTANVAPVTNYAQPKYASLLSAASTNTGVAFLRQYGLGAGDFQAKGAIEYAGTNGTSRSITNINYRYFQPRVGFAYAFTPNTVLRGGYGRFVQANFVANHANQLGYSSTTPFTATNDNFRTSAATLDNPFPNGLVPVTGNSLGVLTSVGTVTSINTPDTPRQYTDDVSLRVQQQVKDFLIDIAGVFDRTTGLGTTSQIDEPSYDTFQAAMGPQFDATGRPVDVLPGNQQVTNPFRGAPNLTSTLATASTISAYQLSRPNPLVNGFAYNVYNGTSEHYSLQTRAQRRYRNGLGFVATFSWSKQMDRTSYFTPSAYSQTLIRQLSPSDRRFQAALSPTYILPFGRGKLVGGNANHFVDELIGGWEISAVYSFYSGTPLVLPTNTAFFQGGNPADGVSKSKNQWFNTVMFQPFPNRSTSVQALRAYPAWTGVQNLPGYNWSPTSSTDLTRNGVYNDFATRISNNPTTYGSVRNPYVNTWNIGLRKNFAIHDAVRLQMRLDAFNALNHPQFGNINVTAGNAFFGYVNGSTSPSQINVPRSIQMEGKLYF